MCFSENGRQRGGRAGPTGCMESAHEPGADKANSEHFFSSLESYLTAPDVNPRINWREKMM